MNKFTNIAFMVKKLRSGVIDGICQATIAINTHPKAYNQANHRKKGMKYKIRSKVITI